MSCELGRQAFRTFSGQNESRKSRKMLSMGIGDLESTSGLCAHARKLSAGFLAGFRHWWG